MGSIGLAALYSALAIGPMGVVAPLAAMSGIVPLAVGLIRGERPEPIQLVGVALALTGVVLAARHRDEAGTRVHPRAVALAVVAAVCLGFLVVLLDEAGRDSPAWAVLMVRVGALSLLAVALLVRRPSFSMDREQLVTLAGVGVLDNGANLLFVLRRAARAVEPDLGVGVAVSRDDRPAGAGRPARTALPDPDRGGGRRARRCDADRVVASSEEAQAARSR